METYFRPATVEDIPGLLLMMETFYAIDCYPFNRDKTENNLTDFMGSEDLGRLWMIELEDMNIGYCALTFGFSFEFGGRIALLDEIFIEENYRNKGIGRKLIRFVQEKASLLGIKTILMEV